jgi:DNA repair exonuclease SbcCD ATPase subunit
VNLLRCHVLGFGKLANFPLTFARGLNVVYAVNEGGKSTLQRFIVALLYGQLRPDVKAQRRLESWVESFKPWRAPDYGGTLWCELANGRELEIYRTFGRDDSRFEIRTTGGEDITRQYETLRNSDVVFAAAHLGLSKELFESVAVIRESETAELRHRETLRDRIANLAHSGDEKLSVRLSLVKLEEAIESVGSERAPTRPYKQALDRLQELREERDELETQRRHCRAWIQERVRLGSEIEGLEQGLKAAGRGVIDARWRDAQLRVRTLEEVDNEIRNLAGEIESLEADPEFPVHRLDDLNRLIADSDNITRRLDEIRRLKQDALFRCEQFETELRKLAAYGALQASVEPEKITEWFVNYLSLSRQRDDLQRTANRLLEEAAALMSKLDALNPVLQDDSIDWERKARQAAEEERSASQQGMVLAEMVAQGRADHARVVGKTRRAVSLAALALLGALGAATAGSAAGLLTFGLSVAAALALLGAVLMAMASKSRSVARQAKQNLQNLDLGLNRLREQAQAAQREVQQAVTSSGLSTTEEFLTAARQAILDRQRLGDLEPRIHEAEQQHSQIQGEAEAVYAHLKECLAKVGLGCAPGNLKAPVDTLRANMRRHAEFQAGHRNVVQEIEALQADEEIVAARASEVASRIRAVLGEAGVATPDEFRRACENCRRLLDLRSREALRVREFERLRGTFTLDQWRARLEELQRLRGGSGSDDHEESSTVKKIPFLPYLPTVEEAEQEERRLADLLSGKREEYARLVERVRQAFHNYRTPAEIEEDLAEADQAVQRLTLNRKALTLALESIRSLARLQQEVCAPQLNRAVEERFLLICPGRYEEVKIDPDFRIQVREQGAVELRAAESLSRGTQDQLYFAVRFGVLELLANGQEPCPCLLDEPFVAYDQERLTAAFRILEVEAGRRQLFLFTCREDVRAAALERGAHLVAL